MSDRRTTPRNARVAHVSLKDSVTDVPCVEGTLQTVCTTTADIRREPAGDLERQLLFGDGFRVLEPDSGKGYCFGQARDGDYVGYVLQSDLGVFQIPTHIVCSMGAHVYPEPSLKTVPQMALPFAGFLAVAGAENGYVKLATGGFVPLQQVAPIGRNFTDFVEVAERFLGVPYLWGGDSNTGLDCSALVHISLRAQGIYCPRDSDMQASELGNPLPDDAELQRGDLIFWKGHVGIMTDSETLVHATADVMAVTRENLSAMCKRVIAAGEGRIIARRRLGQGIDL